MPPRLRRWRYVSGMFVQADSDEKADSGCDPKDCERMRANFALQKFVGVAARKAGALTKTAGFSGRVSGTGAETVCDVLERAPN
jgi:hypothetical protein